MSVENVGPPFAGKPDDGLRVRAYLAPFADPCGPARSAGRSVKRQTVDRFRLRPFGFMAEAGDAADLETLRRLRLHDGAHAEGIAAVQRQRVVEDVQHAGHRDRSMPRQT